MGLLLEANYSKKLGLPGYSSHQYSVTVRTELTDTTKVDQESQRLYALLQGCVDRELAQTGFVPGQTYASPNDQRIDNHQLQNGSGLRPRFGEESSSPSTAPWKCSPKQKRLIFSLVEEQKLNIRQVEDLASEMFGISLPNLNKSQASGLITELTSNFGKPADPLLYSHRNERKYAAGGGA